MAADLYINHRITIPGSDLSWTAVRASGPGGQNVNKVSSKVDLRLDLRGTKALSPSVKARLRTMTKVDAEGRVVITSQVTRMQTRNLDDARERLAAMIRQALVVPKHRRKTKPSRGSVKRRLNDKKRQSDKKKGRRFQSE